MATFQGRELLDLTYGHISGSGFTVAFGLPNRFNLIAFSSSVESWQQELVSVSTESVGDALRWLNTIKARGNSYLLQALKVSKYGVQQLSFLGVMFWLPNSAC